MAETNGYEFFDHTADVGIHAWGRTLQDVFGQGALALRELVVERSAVRAVTRRPVSLEGDDEARLFQQWLTELLFWFSTDKFLPAEWEFTTLTPTRLEGTVAGEPFDVARHAQGQEVKAITLHELALERTPDGWDARVIVDV